MAATSQLRKCLSSSSHECKLFPKLLIPDNVAPPCSFLSPLFPPQEDIITALRNYSKAQTVRKVAPPALHVTKVR